MTEHSAIKHNVRAHDRIVRQYEAVHGEIFNEHEQLRLNEKLALAIAMTGPVNRPVVALDFGCGSGNLTRILLELGCKVVSADVSLGFLRLVERQYGGYDRHETLQLNGRDLAGVADGQFDLVAAYSVLHHIPDYLLAVRELARVIRRGGILFLDHELSSAYWEGRKQYNEFIGLVQPAPKKQLRRFFILKNYLTMIRRVANPRYQPEGDLHVWPDDHLEWPRIRQALQECGVEVVKEEDYLLFRRGYDREVFRHYEQLCHDMHLLIGRKRGPSTTGSEHEGSGESV